ncbi:hypothetical protein ACFL2Q_11420 [Thermodesulfobacteriota bacterium]
MRNNRGSAVIIALLVLGILSLLGVALLTQAKLGAQLTSSIKSYDKMLNLADGGATIAFDYLRSNETDVEYTGQYVAVAVKDSSGKDINASNPNQKKSLVAIIEQNANPESTLESMRPIVGDRNVGTLESGLGMKGYQATAPAGYELGEWYEEFWVAEGVAERTNVYGVTGDKPKSTVHIQLSKIRRNK